MIKSKAQLLAGKSDMAFLIKSIVFGVCFCLNLLALRAFFFGEKSIYAWQKAIQRGEEIQQELISLEKKNIHLSSEIRLLQSDPAYIEKTIRQQLNYVKGSEILYIFEENKTNTYWSRTDKDE